MPRDIRSVEVKPFDGFEPFGFYVKPFDVKIEYEVVDQPSYSDHPYGESEAREYHSGSVCILKMYATEDVLIFDESTLEQDLQKSYPAGTELKNILGFDQSIAKHFENLVQEHFDENQ